MTLLPYSPAMRLTGKRALVIGGGGIGHAATGALGNEGAAVLVADVEDKVVDEILVGRFGRSEEVAEAVVYLAFDAASYVTGQQVVLDGGVSARGPFA